MGRSKQRLGMGPRGSRRPELGWPGDRLEKLRGYSEEVLEQFLARTT